MTWILTKTDDPYFKKESKKVKWIQWVDGRGDSLHDEPEIERSLIMSPFNEFHTWLTSTIKEFTKISDEEYEFTTKNSSYNLKLKKQQYAE